jgi:hypothetical protein
MRKPPVLFTLAVLEMAGLALSALFWFVMRRDLLAAFSGREMPLATRLVLSPWFVPATGGLGALLVLLALRPSLRAKTRMYLASAGLVCTVFGLAFAIAASYVPAFEQMAP